MLANKQKTYTNEEFKKLTHIPDGLEDLKDESYLPTMLFLVGLSIGIVLGAAILFALQKVGRV